MPKATHPPRQVKLSPDQIKYLEERMARLAERNPSSRIPRTDYKEREVTDEREKLSLARGPPAPARRLHDRLGR